MSRNNWELVVDILSYKLSQKGHSWSALNDVEGTTAEAPEGPESEMETPSTTVDNPAGHLLDSPAPPGARGHGCGVDAPEATPVDPVKQTLREVCDDFDRRFQQAFSDMTAQVHITPATARQTFEQVVDELFREEVNWGRIVAFFAFGGALCVQSADKEMRGLVGQIAAWMTTYLNSHLDPWIRDNGGWDTFAELYGNNAAAGSRRVQERFQRWMLAGMTLAGMAVLGSLFFSRK
ncbi:bcl-2-like protein 1 isoform X1 [Sorex araneus]|uniref:bcl-2-like protein 1 isoform X1 n=1 Tax=Sorex araneus TaxID=42254 RepID=UPI002433E21B|nr:bcl-2-like protein 1 isoform X1 [Sorex araneus]